MTIPIDPKGDHQNFIDLLCDLVDGTLAPMQLERLNGFLHDDTCMETAIDHLVLASLLEEQHSHEALSDVVDLVPADVLSRQRKASLAKTKDNDRGLSSNLRMRTVWVSLGVVASCLVVAFFAQWPNSEANAESLVRTAISVHDEQLERVYSVQAKRLVNDVAWTNERNDVRVATTGNRFWVSIETGARRWNWGKDRQGNVWLVPGPRVAMRIERSEIGEPLNDLCEIYGLEITKILEGVLENYDLSVDSTEELSHVIVARQRDNRVGKNVAFEIEIDTETKAIRRMVVERTSRLRANKVTFTLIDSKMPDPSKYSPEGHVETNTTILQGPSTRQQRREILSRRFGPHASAWILNEDK